MESNEGFSHRRLAHLKLTSEVRFEELPPWSEVPGKDCAPQGFSNTLREESVLQWLKLCHMFFWPYPVD